MCAILLRESQMYYLIVHSNLKMSVAPTLFLLWNIEHGGYLYVIEIIEPHCKSGLLAKFCKLSKINIQTRHQIILKITGHMNKKNDYG